MLILVAHGSRDPKWRESIERIADLVRSEVPTEDVGVAFMQFDGPTLTEVVEEMVLSGQRTLRLLPLFMASSGHVEKDVKPLVAELVRRHPGVKLDLMTPVGEDPLFTDLIVDIITRS